MLDSEIIKFEKFLDNNLIKLDSYSQLNSSFKMGFISNNDNTILLQITTKKCYDINNCSLIYQVYFEIFNCITCSYIYDKFLKRYNDRK